MATIDERILEVVRRKVLPTPEDRQAICAQVAAAEFSTRFVRTEPQLRDAEYLGRTIREREPSLFTHLVKRVLYDRDLAPDTTPEEYCDHLKRVPIDADVRVAVYSRRGAHFVLLAAPTRHIIPEERLGPNAQHWLCVIYSAEHGTIVTGYQVRSLMDIRAGDDILWLP